MYHWVGSKTFVDAFYIGLILIASSGSVWSLKCVQCMSLKFPECETGNVGPTECVGKNSNAKYCVRYSGKIHLGQFVIRSCSVTDYKQTCQEGQVEEEVVNVCYVTCNYDGCNSAHSSLSPRLSVVTFAATAAIFSISIAFVL
ncbi:U-scoloptoxin(05)-Sm1a-like [Haliotis rufescens]|uniref:U-scoloptoxin(05)-Sm1a-like n=1 Tax=Haliotis rufescens TaxID=6454 RepID=UPI00201F2622|nr:U-scoloptoxin(05)-Sm1a-like [Haliotis rufescens]